MKLYYHKTDGGAEYLTDKYIKNPDGSKEGVFDGARYIIRIDGDIERDAELVAMPDVSELLRAAKTLLKEYNQHIPDDCTCPKIKEAYDTTMAAIHKAEGR